MSLKSQLLQSAITKGKTQWLQKYLSENLPSLDLPSTNYQHWFDDFIHTLESKGLSKPSQQKNYLTNVRNAIKVFDPNHPALEVIKFSKDTWIAINEADRDRIAERSTKLIDNPDAIVNTAIELIKTNNWSDIAAGLAVLTGRRCGEIIKTAQFEYKTKYTVTFKGALKRRNEAVELVFEIPVLCRANLIIEAIDSLRLQLGDEVKALSITQINQRYEERVAQKCDHHFSALVPARDGEDNLYSHLFRAIYATIACYWFCPPTVPEMEYRAAIQGHYKLLNEKDEKLRRSLATSRHYFDYKIADGSDNIDGRLGIKLGLPGVKIIEQFHQGDRHNHTNNNLSSISSASPSLDNKNPTKTTRVKSSPAKSTMNTNEQSNSLSEAVVSLQLSLSRLESISNLLDLGQTETINTLVDWAEAGASLARHLNIDNPTPEALTTHVKELNRNYFSLSAHHKKSVPNEPLTNTQSGSISNDEQKRLLLTVSSLSNSVEFLTKALVEGKSYSTELAVNSSPQPKANHHQDADSSNQTRNNSQTSHENLENQNNRRRTRRTSSDTRERDTPEVMTEDINRAINAIMEFNNTTDRPHRQKFRVSIKPVADLTGRATNSVSKILKERSEEIESHHEQHEISSYHNKSRRDGEGNDYLPVESEPEINYQKVTEIAQAE